MAHLITSFSDYIIPETVRGEENRRKSSIENRNISWIVNRSFYIFSSVLGS